MQKGAAEEGQRTADATVFQEEGAGAAVGEPRLGSIEVSGNPEAAEPYLFRSLQGTQIEVAGDREALSVDGAHLAAGEGERGDRQVEEIDRVLQEASVKPEGKGDPDKGEKDRAPDPGSFDLDPALGEKAARGSVPEQPTDELGANRPAELSRGKAPGIAGKPGRNGRADPCRQPGWHRRQESGLGRRERAEDPDGPLVQLPRVLRRLRPRLARGGAAEEDEEEAGNRRPQTLPPRLPYPTAGCGALQLQFWISGRSSRWLFT